jgi:SAM-dependent methyltransferase
MNPAELAHIAELEDSFWWYAGMRKILFSLLDPVLIPSTAPDRPLKMLEIGCGTGYMTRQLEQRYKLISFPTDLAWEALEYTKQIGVGRAVQSDVTVLPYAAQTFDMAMGLDVLVHLRPGDEQRALRELARVLKSGALLVLRVAALDILRSRHSQYILELQRFTRKRLSSLIVAHGFQLVRCTYANTILMPVALAKFRIWESLLRRPPASGVTQIGNRTNRLLGRALMLEDKWLRKGRDLPLGQSLIAIARKV